ncbi:MAG: 2-amino-4-hydroxy-6-hydroxymethyldihydropteridine diphosphokinase [Bacteroidia bacterium]|nr:2-amino-4-hydroxy-6-hydroxymethyldihydropteridine diphosphokinase [Bacteroidia bacterium]
MSRFVLSLGTNLGDKSHNLGVAKHQISKQIGEISGESSVYKTAAWGNLTQPEFYNQIIEGRTSLSPESLMSVILNIETDMGRLRTTKWSPRIIDIDILFYESIVLDKPELNIPHPMFHLRGFTLVPLAELMPDFIDPRSGKSMNALLEELNDELEVIKAYE